MTSVHTSIPQQGQRVLPLLPAAACPQPVGEGRGKAELTPPTLSEQKDTIQVSMSNWGCGEGGQALEPSP